ncbi:MAG: phage portal protein, partial [bacterium]|nr:phage portal protein [bacterium]
TKVCRDAIGLAIATEESQSLLHANGAHPGGLLSIDGRLGDPGKQQLRDMARERMEGLQNAYRTLVLDQGARWTPFQMTGVDNQHLETRRFQVEEICRGLGVLPIMVGHYDKAATFASAEQMFLHHVVHTIRPWHRRFEYSMNHQLLTPDQRHEGFYFRFVDTELLRGDHKTRGEYYQKAIEAGWMVPEEPRGFEDMPWVAGLDRPRMPLNQAIVDENGVVVPNDPKSESR